MRIDIVTDTYFPDINGVAMTLGRLVKGLIGNGHRVRVIRSGDDADGSTRIAAIKLPGYKEVSIGLPGPLKFRKRWKKKRPDVIYVATESPMGMSAVSVASAMGIPITTGFHTNFHQYMEQYRLKGLKNAAMGYLKQLHSRALATFAPSREVVEMLQKEGIAHAQLLGRGVDTELYSPKRRCEQLRSTWSAEPESCVFLVVGRVAVEKNIPLAIAAVAHVRTTHPDARLVIVGDGPQRTELEKTYPWVNFSGAKLDEELATYYASADVLLFPSETETFGNVILEGLASGLHVIAYDYAAAAEVIDHEQNGSKCTKGDSQAFKELSRMAASQSHASLRIAACESVQQRSWASIVEHFQHQLAKAARHRDPMINSKGQRLVGGQLECRTVFLSDIHLGTSDSKTDEVVSFLKHVRCKKLVLNGDIIDGWALKRGTRWQNRHSRVIRTIMKKMEKEHTEVLYLRGNHDDILDRFLPFAFGNLRLIKEHIHMTPQGAKYLVVHGDGFDSVATNHKWLALLGAFGYDSLLTINRVYNQYRSILGKEYFSLSKAIKGKVKSAVAFVDKYEEQLQNLAHKRNCQGIICGHIHTPADKMVGDIHYLNSGDWVESLTAVIEHHDGRMQLVTYQEFMRLCSSQLMAEADSTATQVSLAEGQEAACLISSSSC
jgi:UDP-2,3-diacylglucosamine pyrophosphatase LpxH/glycosyltransferase involved in cell wall biosynthesis